MGSILFRYSIEILAIHYQDLFNRCFRDLNLTLPKQGTNGKHGVANLSFTYTYADKQRYQKQISLEQEEEDSVERESKISRNYRHQIEDDKFTRF